MAFIASSCEDLPGCFLSHILRAFLEVSQRNSGKIIRKRHYGSMIRIRTKYLSEIKYFLLNCVDDIDLIVFLAAVSA